MVTNDYSNLPIFELFLGKLKFVIVVPESSFLVIGEEFVVVRVRCGDDDKSRGDKLENVPNHPRQGVIL